MAGNLDRTNDLGLGQGWGLRIATGFALFFLLLPLAILVVYAFNDSRQVTVWTGFSTRWFAVALQDRELWMAIRNSIIIASANAVIATALGTSAALALGRGHFRGRGLFAGLLYLPILVPEIILGAGLLLLVVMLDIPRGFLTVLCGHITLSFPFVTLLVLARVQALDRAQEEASLDLGETPWRTFVKILLPALAPAMLSGALFAFTMSLDDFVLTFFTASPQVMTLPLKVYSMVKFGLSPAINVISVMLILFTLVALAAVDWLQQDGRRQQWGMRLGGTLAAVMAVMLTWSVAAERKQETLVIANWSEYLMPELIDAFEKETGIIVVMHYFNDAEEMLAKVSMGRPGIDLIVPPGYLVETIMRRGLLAEIDSARIPNARHLDPRFRNLSFDPEGRHYLPYTIGLTGISYNRERITEPVDSWNIFWDERLRGRILMFSDMLECFHLAHRMLGYRMDDRNTAELDEALELLRQQRPLLRKYESNLINDMLAGGDADIAQNWNGNALRLMMGDDRFAFVVPREGSLMFADNFCLLSSAPNPDAAHRFLDFLFEPAHAAKNMEYIMYAMPHPAAKALLPEKLRNNNAMFPPMDDLSRLDIMPDYGSYLTEIQKRWTRLRNE